jgi:protein-S-isoprenylcysteine O-methyltransferase Ste14
MKSRSNPGFVPGFGDAGAVIFWHNETGETSGDTHVGRACGGIEGYFMKRLAIFLYGIVSYAVFFATFLYGIGFIGNLWVPKSIDSPRDVALGTALAVNLGLLALFAVQHSVMARPAFKRWWTRIVPEPAERATYVLFSSLALIVLFWFWQPMGGVVWSITSEAGVDTMYAIYAAGWLLLLYVTFLIDHFDLFGLRQVWLQLVGKPFTPVTFKTPWLYRQVRHPLYVGWLMIFWATPTMTVAHLVFAIMTTAYILIAIQFEEHDLIVAHPEYADYKRRVPALIPFTKRRSAETARVAGRST